MYESIELNPWKYAVLGPQPLTRNDLSDFVNEACHNDEELKRQKHEAMMVFVELRKTLDDSAQKELDAVMLDAWTKGIEGSFT